VRGIRSAVTGDDLLCLHGCTLSVGAGAGRRGVIITGSSGAGKATLAARLLRQPEYQVAVLNDDWGAVSLDSGASVSTGEQMLHMKSSSVQALSPGFFASAPGGEAVMALENQAGLGSVHHHEAFFNGSLILTTEDDKLREEKNDHLAMDLY
jgi:hypothetical protein